MEPFPFSNVEFFVMLIPALLLVLVSKRLGAAVYTWTLVAVSIGFFAWLPDLRVPYALLCAALVTMTFLAAWLRARRHARFVVALVISVVIAAFVVVRLDVAGLWTPPWTERRSLLPIFGFAFLAIKAYGLLIDVMSGRVKSVRLVDVVLYFAYFPTLIAGPIFRYGDFVAQLEASRQLTGDASRIAGQLPRLLFGAFKVMVLAALLEPYSIQSLPADVIGADARRVYLGSLTYYFFEYINFSGYTDMAIAVSVMIGLRPPENFNLPFIARNLTELWRRWHMSFASWLRDYIYFPLNFQIVSLLRLNNQTARALSSGAAILLTFLFCGFWHGVGPGTLLFGALSGLVLAVEAVVAGLRWRTGIGARLEQTASGRIGHDTVRQIWTLHLAAATFAPVLLDRTQIEALGHLLVKAL